MERNVIVVFLTYHFSLSEFCPEGYGDLSRTDTLIIRILQHPEITVSDGGEKPPAAEAPCSFRAKRECA